MRRMMLVMIAVLLTACSGAADRPHVVSTRASLEQGRAAAASWMSAGDRDSVSAETAIALGYLERLRLGLGSPFRLIDYALQDPRLNDDARTALAWSLLSRTLNGEAYQVDGAALDRAGASSMYSWPGIGTEHLQLITNAIEDAQDPRSGELAIRVGYALAATEGSLPQHGPRYATNAAALIRDRALAREDARDIVRTAETTRTDALRLVQQWRVQRKLRVEAPPLASMPQEDERAALSRGTAIARALRELGASARSLTSHRPDSVVVNRTLLSATVARKLRALADAMPMPPVAPLVIGARGYDRELASQPWLSAEERVNRRALETAGSEERFVAQYAQLSRTGPYDVGPSLVALWSAVGMRAMAQEAVWYPGYPAPTARELASRYGLKSVTFSSNVPVAWQPYYRRMIDVALTDMKLVLPALDVRGLSIRFQEVGRDAGTLAMHDPAKRRLLLPPSTAAGTLAHEITHDLDWQVALRQYDVRGDYASDRSLRKGIARGDRFAARMHELASGSTLPPRTAPRLAAHAKRPTEILARNVDFLVATALADRGRTNGYLSSVQDELLTGYGTVRAPELTGVTADALVTVLDRIAPVNPDARNAFLRSYGTGRSLGSYDLVRRVIETPIPEASGGAASATASDLVAFNSIAQARSLGDQAIDQWTCRVPDGAHTARLESARRLLVREAALARARGYAIRRARALMGRPAAIWVAGQLNGGPWHVDGVTPEMEVYLGELVDGARAVSEEPANLVTESFALSAPPARCRGVQFLFAVGSNPGSEMNTTDRTIDIR